MKQYNQGPPSYVILDLGFTKKSLLIFNSSTNFSNIAKFIQKSMQKITIGDLKN